MGRRAKNRSCAVAAALEGNSSCSPAAGMCVQLFGLWALAKGATRQLRALAKGAQTFADQGVPGAGHVFAGFVDLGLAVV